MYDKDKIKESLTREDVDTILFNLGSGSSQSDSKGNPVYNTVCHNAHGGSPKLYYYEHDSRFNCYTNCGVMDIYEIVIQAKKNEGEDYSFYEAVKLVADLTGKHYHSEEDFDTEKKDNSDWELINKFTQKTPPPPTDIPTVSESVMNVYMEYINNWVDEDITPDVAELYNIGWYISQEAIIIPHYNEYGGLVGIRQRNTKKEDVDSGRKYIPTYTNGKLYNHQTSKNLYGLNISKENIRRHKRVYIFEGEKSCMKAQAYYGEDNFSVAVSGSNISPWQERKIMSLGVQHVIIAFDKFRAKKEHEPESVYQKQVLLYQQKLLRVARRFAPFVRVYILWDDNDYLEYTDSPIDAGKEVFEKLTEHKYEITTKEVDYDEIKTTWRAKSV